jgi:hypothetical protein
MGYRGGREKSAWWGWVLAVAFVAAVAAALWHGMYVLVLMLEGK